MISEQESPFDLFDSWFGDAKESETSDPNAVAVATVSGDGKPSVRMVLLKSVDEQGFVFYTNLGSRKANQIEANNNVAMCFHWKSLKRQVRVEGAVQPVSPEEADEYFGSRPKMSQIGAWASKQSQKLEGRLALEKRIAEYTAKFNIGTVPRPEFWSGFRLVPEMVEFWQDQTFRLHDRIVYERDGDGWATHRLFP
ncbi:MAG: pyridoxamine 5'-phosphate oxidase [Rhodospirillales bacterium]|jgi:pyridoxamine 5'-phosphate oxidase|nr:pyridoxamine 5'-phosphate oxidase [Rhodospirillales bacterium]MBT4041376.1 pyridoxamine 5'-phosphate oxidase [Rhodospirillales bacterium]MBT4628185.1 pyridoxamine 5'-phosphate oxidase [Rhodospirillales bacterium]MBT5351790.1 pyridoxamine 5'-phosphate oxidase [Rhodospirillales bacterium]MBT5519964.1 pyridoxamine 5'-phosphate oxidase [Rhodospirillales bacterium]